MSDQERMAERDRKTEDRFALGFKVSNPDAPLNEPRRFEPLNPEAQAKADKFFWKVREKGLAAGK
ncbi:hypothetical protein M9M90_00950 [Phenylobacterium sp. LH3H17]|uniref:hypothetical protein n=1 Tax=Phenylobacterium sp. LH3H17 TaxID=2903901 RepID=UPI0020C9A005|nr:hypothetical protein [Phenylobacterium sp. LH3H17]UTP39774.1 hypothetical protein M9M90_00950 [Phenylobacterium sp. LH3H17]